MSKILRGSAMQVLVRVQKLLHEGHGSKKYSQILPPTQYDTPIPKRLKLGYVMKEYWETIPLFATTCVALTILFSSIVWAIMKKVDVVYSTHNRENISRTMDLRNPTVHKIVLINQRYEPWPEMQDVLDKMRTAEKRILDQTEMCSFKH